MNGIYGLIAGFFAGTEGVLPRIFSSVLTMSVSASLVIVCVLLIRLLLRRAPRIFSYVLWAVVLLRLLCPVVIESPVAIVPAIGAAAAVAEQDSDIYTDDSHTQAELRTDQQTVAATTADTMPVYRPAEETVTSNPDMDSNAAPSETPRPSPAQIISAVWLLVGAGIGLYSLVSLLRLRLRLREALRLNQNVYLCDRISTPFVMGIFNPRIYLPAGLGTLERSYIIRHEQHHIRRLDHITKLLAFISLCIHWFNPLVWLAFVLAVRDMEMSCDEAVMRVSGNDIRADYSLSLLALASGKRMFAPTPLAFGESDTKVRIKNIVRYKKPATIVVVCAALAVAAACGVLGGSRAAEDEMPQSGDAAPEDLTVEDAAENGGADKPVADGGAADAVAEDVTRTEPELTPEQREEAARTRLIASIPGLTLTEGADLHYTTDNTQPFEQEDIHNITEAYLLCDFGLLTLTDAVALESLSQTYMSAEKHEGIGIPGCGFYTPLFIKRADGTVGYVYPASDGCGTFKAGDSYYEYDEDFFNFYALFGMDYMFFDETDDLGRVIRIHEFSFLRQRSLAEYEYDGDLLVTYTYTSSYRTETVEYEHDDAGLLVKKVQTTKTDSSTDTKEYAYAYDARGNCISITITYSGRGRRDVSVYYYAYDEHDRLIQRQLDDNGDFWPATQYEYDEDGNCIKVITVSVETGESSGWSEYRYDDQGRVVWWDSYNGDGSRTDYYYHIQVYEPDGTTYRQMYDLDGNFIENVMVGPPAPVNGPFFYD